MKARCKFAAVVPLASAMMFAQSPVIETPRQSEARPHTYTGDIVNANCYQAAEIVNRNSRGYTRPATTNAFTPGIHKPVPNASPKKKKEILRH